ncbi:MAG: MFS transporter [Pseudonocardiaceae bacterium]
MSTKTLTRWALAPTSAPPTPTPGSTTAVAPASGMAGKHRHRWTVLGIGVTSQAAFSVAFQGIPATGAAMRDSYHLTNATLGLVLGAISLGIALTEVGWGVLTDRVGERRILVGGLLATAACLAGAAAFVVPTSGYTPPVVLLMVTLLAVGALGGSVNGSSGRAVMAWFAKRDRGLAMSIRQTAVPAGGAIGAALLPFLAVTFGFRSVFGILALLCVLASAAAILWLHEPPAGAGAADEVPAHAPTGPAPITPDPLHRWDVWRMAISGGLLTCPQFAILTFGSVFLHDVKHMSIASAALVLVVVQILGATGRVLTGRISDRRGGGRRPIIKLLGWASAITFAATAVAGSLPTIIIIVLLGLAGTFASSWHGVAYAEIAEMAGIGRAATALGMENTTVFTGAFVIPMLIPVVLLAGWPAVWALVAVCSVTAAWFVPQYTAKEKTDVTQSA